MTNENIDYAVMDIHLELQSYVARSLSKNMHWYTDVLYDVEFMRLSSIIYNKLFYSLIEVNVLYDNR